MDFVTFNIIIDDIVFPDGRTEMGVLGGSGPQTAFAMKLWANKVGLVAGVGSDYPPEAQAWLETMGIDTEGVIYSAEWPTPRAWQAMEADGRRTQVWRVPNASIGPQLGRSIDRLPPGYRNARGFHFGIHLEEPHLDFSNALRDLGAVVSLESFRPVERPLTDSQLRTVLSAGQIFSPNQLEAASMVGSDDPLEIVHRLAAAGAEVIALRQGAAGAMVHRADSGETWQIPAVQTTVVDPVGAGNAFCGGFLVGWVQTDDLRTAGLYGSVSASFLVEQAGVPEPRAGLIEEAKARLQRLQPQLRRMS